MNQLDALLQALNISPDNDVLRNLIAKLQFNEGAHEEAYKNYEYLYKSDRGNIENLEYMIRCLMEAGSYEEAQELLENELKQREDWAFGLMSLSRCVYNSGEYDEAMKNYEKAVDISPELEDGEFHQLLLKYSSSQKVKLKVLNFEEFDEADDYEFSKSKVTFQDVGGMDTVKESIRINIIFPLNNPAMFKAYGKAAGGGILLYGPPGCGKTFIARATAGECNAYFTNITITDILDMYIGESEKNLHSIFQTARRKKPAIIFIDEIDAIGGSRQNMRNSAGRSITNQLLIEMDSTQNNNENLLVIGATNTPWHVDSALRRPGRFDRIIFIPPPDLKARIDIIKLHLKDKPYINIDYEAIAKKMHQYSGADIKAVCDVASEEVIKLAMKKGEIIPIATTDLLKAIKIVKPSTLEWLNTAKNYATYSNQSGVYDDILNYLKSEK